MRNMAHKNNIMSRLCWQMSSSDDEQQPQPDNNSNRSKKGSLPPQKKKNNSCFCCWSCCTCPGINKEEAKSSPNNHQGERKVQPREPRIPLEEVLEWGRSFDKLMKVNAGRNVFKDFLKCEYSEENILFWTAVEDYKLIEDPDLVAQKAKFIYEDFISILSPREVSLDSRVRDMVNQNMREPTVHSFDEAQHQIYTLMHRDSYPRFVNSHVYKRFLAMYNEVDEDKSSQPSCSNA